MYLQILLAVLAIAALRTASAQEGSHCENSCGNVTISFPFGSVEGCYYNPDFLVTCDRSSAEPKLFLESKELNIVITNLATATSEMEVMMYTAEDCYNSFGRVLGYTSYLRLLETERDIQISTKNKFVAIGCDTHAYFRGIRGNASEGTGCSSICDGNSRITNGSCSGVGCCQVAVVPEGLRTFDIRVSSYNNHTNITNFNPCSYAFFVEDGKFNFSSNYLRDFGSIERPMLLDWAIGNSTCDISSKNLNSFLCKGNSLCDKNYKGRGYRCVCSEGYEGNPYRACNNINECTNGKHDCRLDTECIDNEGNYTCKCGKGYSGDGRKNGTGCTADQSTVRKIVVGFSVAALLLIVFVNWLYFVLKKRKLMMLREKFFKQNGGIMLQQRISGDGGSHDQANVFTSEDLKKATNNYHESRIIGKGGYGTVYKGILSDNRIVAIKKSKLADQTQTEQFINEVVILSQINHRNVVKLIGCCLETEVPLLVYEFIPNGTLSEHIHNKGKSSAITWDIRLRIATEIAEALSYLHSAASVPIIHRDIKPMNILLDDSYVAKVADFGASRLIPMDQIELATIVQGTLGYLDPEYMQTNQLTDKSDVYSFAVVLVELLTGKRALSFDRPEEERNLAMHFLSSLKKGRLIEVLDEHLQKSEDLNEIIKVSRLAERCLHVKGDERPTMKEVAMELEGILASMIKKHPWVQIPLNEDEAEYLLKEPSNEYDCTNGANGSSSTFDSMSQHTILSIPSGR